MSKIRFVSPSQLDTYRRCSLAWYYSKIEHAREERVAGVLVLGSCVDVSVKSIVHAVRERTGIPSPADAEEECRRAWASELLAREGTPIVWGERADAAKSLEIAIGLVQAFVALPDLGQRIDRIVELDLKVDVPLVNPLTGLSEPGLRLTGILDALEKSPKTGKLRPLDWKTAASRSAWSDPREVQERLQSGLYSAAVHQLYGDAASDEMSYFVGMKTKAVTWADVDVELDETHRRRALLTAIHVAGAMSAGIRVPNPGFMCGSCSFLDRCRTWHETPASDMKRDIFAA